MKVAHLGRLIRTVRHLRPVQITAQLRHTFGNEGRGGEGVTEASERAVDRATVPFLDAPAHARYDGALGFELLRRKHRFREEIDWDFEGYGPLWLFHLHQFDYARGVSVTPSARAELIDDWIEACQGGIGWSPHPISLRILSWGKLMLTPGALGQGAEASSRMHHSLAQQAQALCERLETRLQANHLFSNLLSCVFAGLLFKGTRADGWLALEGKFRDELDTQILDDGAHIERSPMYHALLLENVLDLLNLARAAGTRAPSALIESLEKAAARMLGAHRVWTHPDGEIALLGDSAFEIAHPPSMLEAYAASLGVVVRAPSKPFALDRARVFRLEAGDIVVIASASEPQPSYQPGHAHCDALSFELSVGTQRVISDTGVTEYIPGPLRDISRATTSHATLQFDDAEQSEIWSAHRVGGRAKVDVDHFERNRLDASCSSWASLGTCHHRSFRVDANVLEIEDRVEGALLPVRFALPFAPGLEPTFRSAGPPVAAPRGDDAKEQASKLCVSLEDGKRLEVELPIDVRWTLERCSYFPHFGSHIERACLVGKADNFVSGRWRFEIVSV